MKPDPKYTPEDVIKAFEDVEVEIEVNQLSLESRAKLKGTFFAKDFDGNYRFIAYEEQASIDQTIIDGWFTAVLDELVEGV